MKRWPFKKYIALGYLVWVGFGSCLMIIHLLVLRLSWTSVLYLMFLAALIIFGISSLIWWYMYCTSDRVMHWIDEKRI